MAALAAVAAGVGQAMKAFNLQKQKIAETKAYREAGNRTMAATTRDMDEEQRNKELMHSRALALAAASGGGVDDPGMVKILGDLNAEGEYRVMAHLWSGQDRAAGLQFRAAEAKKEGDAAIPVGIINALSAGASAYSRSGGTGLFGSSGSAASVGAGASGATSVTGVSGVSGGRYTIPSDLAKAWGGNVPIGVLNKRGIRPRYG